MKVNKHNEYVETASNNQSLFGKREIFLHLQTRLQKIKAKIRKVVESEIIHRLYIFLKTGPWGFQDQEYKQLIQFQTLLENRIQLSCLKLTAKRASQQKTKGKECTNLAHKPDTPIIRGKATNMTRRDKRIASSWPQRWISPINLKCVFYGWK